MVHLYGKNVYAIDKDVIGFGGILLEFAGFYAILLYLLDLVGFGGILWDLV